MMTCPFIVVFYLGANEGLPPVSVDQKHQLFLDDYLIASMTGVTREIHPARKHPANPVLWPTEPWEGKVAVIYGSVIRDDGKYRMWYHGGAGVSYAESEDGIKWTKPLMGLVREQLEEALFGRVTDHHGFLLRRPSCRSRTVPASDVREPRSKSAWIFLRARPAKSAGFTLQSVMSTAFLCEP